MKNLNRALAAAGAATIAALFAAAPLSVDALGLYEPADGKVILAAWVDPEDPRSSPSGGDSPSAFNSRLGLNAGAFSLAQNIPLSISPYTNANITADVNLVQATNTDAIFIVTVYPLNGYGGFTDNDVQILVDQLDNISNPSKSSRKVMLRFAPEMNGNWFPYGQKPTAFLAAYKKIVDAIRKRTQRVAIIWAPNAGNNYPFGTALSDAETKALDTNGDGTVDNNDDPYTPYWPGADYVDWVGLSLYWKGYLADGYPQTKNTLAPNGFVETMVQGGQEGPNPNFPFYTMFAAKYNKPMLMGEGGAAFQLYYTPSGGSQQTLSPGVGRLALQQSFWRTYLTNTTFLDKYPKFKLFDLFEHIKTEDSGVTRDYRISNDSATLAAFKSDLAAVQSRYVWGGPFQFGVDPTATGSGSGGSGTTPTGSGTSSTGTTSTKSAAVRGAAAAAGWVAGAVGAAAAVMML
ncbi:glycoside hydrolase superfamily [Zopfochytrium polystomum]|nr:glycoside hydrolase superfamily [Zopfochytrium polystomum]